MLRSLVGSEMCIRDRSSTLAEMQPARFDSAELHSQLAHVQQECAEKIHDAVLMMNEYKYKTDMKQEQLRQEMTWQMEEQRSRYDSKAKQMFSWCESEILTSKQMSERVREQLVLEAAQETALQDLKTEHAGVISQVEAESRSAISMLEAQHQEELAKQRQEHDCMLEQLKRDHTETLRMEAERWRATLETQLDLARGSHQLAMEGAMAQAAKVSAESARLLKTAEDTVARMEIENAALTETSAEMEKELDRRAEVSARLSWKLYQSEKKRFAEIREVEAALDSLHAGAPKPNDHKTTEDASLTRVAILVSPELASGKSPTVA
eukprot:TRINITY_DN30567_c0_g1_i1.p1 TRINITY_DN30567_c0_g1~~TRINITY_DN30567_c0_g1_i1.p1  ORF type:complete len:323 (+),score=94.75 TRINITY_DN30567_c0_g1_i1:142-1110(+)